MYVGSSSPFGASLSAPLPALRPSRSGNLLQFLIGLNVIAIVNIIFISQYQNQNVNNIAVNIEPFVQIGVPKNRTEDENETTSKEVDDDVLNDGNCFVDVGVVREGEDEGCFVQSEGDCEVANEGVQDCGDGTKGGNEAIVKDAVEGGSERPGQVEYEFDVGFERHVGAKGKGLAAECAVDVGVQKQVQEEREELVGECEGSAVDEGEIEFDAKDGDASQSGGEENCYIIEDLFRQLFDEYSNDNQSEVGDDYRYDGDGADESEGKHEVENDAVGDFEDWDDCQDEGEGCICNEDIIERPEEHKHESHGEVEVEVRGDREDKSETECEVDGEEEVVWQGQDKGEDAVENQVEVDGGFKVNRQGEVQCEPQPLNEFNVKDMEMISCLNESKFLTRTFVCGWEMDRGTFGVVFEMFDIDTGDSLAVKTINTVDLDEEGLIWTRKEITEHLKLKHTNIVELYGAVKDSSFYYLVMEKCDGTLTKGLRQLAVCCFANVVGQINSALEYMHRLGMVHRDIKPENLLIGEDGQVKICDFGSVGVMNEDGIVSDGQVQGTPHFAAPEVLLELSFGKAADYYSVGVMMYYYFAGEYPFEEFFPDSKADVEIPMDVPDSTKRLLTGLLKYDSEKRFGSEEVRQWIREQI